MPSNGRQEIVVPPCDQPRPCHQHPQDCGHLIAVATEKALVRDGITAAPLPPALLRAATGVLRRSGITPVDASLQKGPIR